MQKNRSISTHDDGARSHEAKGKVPEAVLPNQCDAEALDVDSMPWNDDDDCANTNEDDDSDLQQTLQSSQHDIPVDEDENPTVTSGWIP